MRIHLIAIGGAVMHNLAMALHKKGYTVSGSDDEIFEPSRSRLESCGLLPPAWGWYPEKITGSLDAVILGMHARRDNPELLRALELGIRIYSFPEYLYEQTKNKKRIVIAGSHGKTTITSMIMHVLKACGMKFDFMVGSKLEGFETMVCLDEENEIAVFEGDEYLSSPLDSRPKYMHYKPQILLISGIAWDHMNVFPSREGYTDQFRQLLRNMEPGGTVYYCAGDPELKALVSEMPSGITAEAYEAISYRTGEGSSVVSMNNKTFPLKIFGKHNVENLSGAMKICAELGIGRETFLEKMSSFRGAARRQELLAQNSTRKVYLDFAHAPSKVKATVAAFREMYPGEKIFAFLELHTFSSLSAEFIPLYKGCLDGADRSFVFFDPAVLEHKKLPMLDPQFILDCFAQPDLCIVTEKNALKVFLLDCRKMEGIVLLMSSGNFSGIDLRAIAGEIVEG
jgi:UDP-N-acetylmuramate: L-alanyl-gamma-D-glutamyl-meso-diaminopimelate ligase